MGGGGVCTFQPEMCACSVAAELHRPIHKEEEEALLLAVGVSRLIA